MVSMEELLTLMVQRGGSDLHISVGSPPKIRIDGKLVDTDYEPLQPEVSKKLIYSVLGPDQVAKFEKNLEIDFSFGVANLGRFRTNAFLQRGTVAAVLRVIPYEVFDFQTIGLPNKVSEEICKLPRGLVLCTGSTGSGKSTTLASMINYINEHRQNHIVTIEDPIEFLHRNKNCLVNQREIGGDTHGFGKALKSVLRQDPDIVLVGEMRDLETIEAALTLAETGHLTFATLHTSDVAQTVNRIVDVFPAHQQQQIRTKLSFTLQA
jgi:twitching motility protein PilT